MKMGTFGLNPSLISCYVALWQHLLTSVRVVIRRNRGTHGLSAIVGFLVYFLVLTQMLCVRACVRKNVAI